MIYSSTFLRTTIINLKKKKCQGAGWEKSQQCIRSVVVGLSQGKIISTISSFQLTWPLGHVSYCHHFSSVVCRSSSVRQPSCLEVGITGHNFERGPSKDHSTKVWLQLVQWFLRRRLKCEMLANQDGRQAKNRKKGGWNFNCPLLL
jgi:hypothetical protein